MTARARPPGLLLLVAQVLLFGLYLALIITPYFVNGLHHEPANLVEGGRFDPKEMWPNDSRPFGVVLTYAAAAANALTWLVTALLAVLAVGVGASTWGGAGRAEHGRLVAVVVLAVAFLAYQFSAFGQHIGAWMAD